MSDESLFLARISATLLHLHDQLEQAYDDGLLEELDVDEAGGVLTIITASEHTFIVSRHLPTRQCWLASPLSGGHHFHFDETRQGWFLPDGSSLGDRLSEDLASLIQQRIHF